MNLHLFNLFKGPVDPHEFYPERFLAQRNPAAWLPFGAGCRKCLGIKFAMSQIKLFIVRLLQSYNLDRPKPDMPNLTHERASEDMSLEELKRMLRTRAKTKTPGGTVVEAEKPFKPFKSLETKDVLFASPLNEIEVSIEPKQRLSF